ncbi:MAG: hypothetical protein COA42_01520 [Alteromonadaceae bacterium]|nr:MAG: hypothetical protein COA42_01520 [Alteromonadaceae bacterium]
MTSKPARDDKVHTLPALLVIDDDADMHELLSDVFADEYDVHSTLNGEEILEHCDRIKPNVILLDILLEKESGLTICSHLRQNAKHQPMILFISGKNGLKQRLEAYNHGGDDFLPKPFQISELRAKVEILNTLAVKRDELKVNNEFATRTALNAMTEASQYGGVLRFFNNMYKASSIEKIRDEFFTLMNDLGLKTSIQFRTETTVEYNSSGQECSPIEQHIYENLHLQGRLIPFSNRLMVNGKFISFIVKNMPVDDEFATGRLNDILATTIEGLDSKAQELLRLNLLRQTAKEVAASSQRLSGIMGDHEGFIVGAMNHVISEINSSFHTLEMNEEQEVFFTGLAENIINSIETSFVRIGNEQNVLNCLWLSLSSVLGTESNDT